MAQKDFFVFDDLFGNSGVQRVELIELEDGEILWVKHYYSPDQAGALFSQLYQQVPWRQDQIRIAGKMTSLPRLQAWFADPGIHYGYSGIAMEPLPWIDCLRTIKQNLEAYSDNHFNSVLANLYRNQHDSVSWHADNETELGTNPTIASLSLGGTREFQLKHRLHPSKKLKIPMQSGDLMIMKGGLQHHWLHQIPKSKTPSEPRINLTFRRILDTGSSK